MKTYLIQRGKFQINENKGGIDSIIRFDYMGSAEFEFGALPKSLSFIRKEINEYIYLDVPIQDKIITVFCKDSQKTEIKEYLIELAKNKMSLKEYSDFDNYIYPDKSLFKFSNETNFWWDIKNNVMFWKKNPDFESKFKTVIN